MEGSWQFAAVDSQVMETNMDELPDEDNSELLQLLEVVQGSSGVPEIKTLTTELSFEHGFVVTVKAIQLLRRKKNGPLLVGIGGPSGSGKSSLASKVAAVLGCPVMSMDNYMDLQKLKDESFDDFSSLDFGALEGNLKDILAGRGTKMPLFDSSKKEKCGYKFLSPAACSVVLLEGSYALAPQVRMYLDIKVAVVTPCARASSGFVSDWWQITAFAYDHLLKVSPPTAQCYGTLHSSSSNDGASARAGSLKSMSPAARDLLPLYNNCSFELDLAGVPLRLEGKWTSFQPLLCSLPQVGGVHFNLVRRVQRDVERSGTEAPLQQVLETLFPNFKNHIEPDLEHAQIRVNNNFEYLASLKDPTYTLKSDKAVAKEDILALLDPSRTRVSTEEYTDVYLKPMQSGSSSSEKEWMRHRQCGVRCFITENTADHRTVVGNFVITPRIEFEVGPKTLGGLLQLGYQVGVSFKRWSEIYEDGELTVCIDTLPEVEKTFVQIKGSDRQIVQAAAARLGLHDTSFLTASYREIYLAEKGESIRRIPSPPLTAAQIAALGATSPLETSPRATSPTESPPLVAPRALRVTPFAVEEVQQPPATSSAPGVSTWQLDTERVARSAEASTSRGGGFTGPVYLKPRAEDVPYDHGYFLAVQATQILGQRNGLPVIVGIGGPSGSGKTSLSKKLANILGSEVLSMESYLDGSKVRDGNYDEFSTLDIPTLKQNLADLRAGRAVQVPEFSFVRKERVGYRDFRLPESGVVILEGIYALHSSIQDLLDLRVAVTGGVQTYLVKRVARDLEKTGKEAGPHQVTAILFPMYRVIESNLAGAHLRIRNNFDPVHSLLDPLYVLKSKKPVSIEALKALLKPEKTAVSVETFSDIFYYLPGTIKGKISDNDWIRVRDSGGRYTILIREPIREGNFILQPRVDFDISSKTVAGLHSLGYHHYCILEVRATIIKDDKVTFELDELERVRGTYLQIKSTNRAAVAAAGEALGLEGTYTTKSFLQILSKESPVVLSETVRSPSAAALEQLVHRVGGQGSETGEDASVESLRAQLIKQRDDLADLRARQSLTELLLGLVLTAVVCGSVYLAYRSRAKHVK